MTVGVLKLKIKHMLKCCAGFGPRYLIHYVHVQIRNCILCMLSWKLRTEIWSWNVLAHVIITQPKNKSEMHVLCYWKHLINTLRLALNVMMYKLEWSLFASSVPGCLIYTVLLNISVKSYPNTHCFLCKTWDGFLRECFYYSCLKVLTYFHG